MAKLTRRDAVRVAGVAHSILHRASKAGRLRIDPDGHRDTAALWRGGYMLQGSRRQHRRERARMPHRVPGMRHRPALPQPYSRSAPCHRGMTCGGGGVTCCAGNWTQHRSARRPPGRGSRKHEKHAVPLASVKRVCGAWGSRGHRATTGFSPCPALPCRTHPRRPQEPRRPADSPRHGATGPATAAASHLPDGRAGGEAPVPRRAAPGPSGGAHAERDADTTWRGQELG